MSNRPKISEREMLVVLATLAVNDPKELRAHHVLEALSEYGYGEAIAHARLVSASHRAGVDLKG